MHIGLDLGTSGLKAVLMDEAGTLVASHNAPLASERPHSGWSEQDADSWIAACEAALDALAARNDLSRVRGIGLSGQMHGATLLDSADRPLRPCMLWNDTRSAPQAARLDADPRFRRITGNIVFPGFTAPKVEWVRENEPDVFAATRRILLPKDYLRLWLTGDAASDPSDASGTSWLDVGARDWSDELLEATHLSRAYMPALVEGSQASGTLRTALGERWGMARVPLAGGGGDNAATAIGLGAVRDGDAFASLGTSGVLFAATNAFRPDPETAVHAFCHALPDTWHQMGVFLSATDAMNWWAGICGASPAELTASLADDGPSGLLFLPYLAGERTPHNDATVRGAFLGLDHAHDRDAMTRAVLEGVAFALADSRDALRSAGTAIERVMAVGGGSRSSVWLRIMAEVLELPVDVVEGGEVAAALGAARLGALAAGGAVDDVVRPARVLETHEPSGRHASRYREALSGYREAYRSIRSR